MLLTFIGLALCAVLPFVVGGELRYAVDGRAVAGVVEERWRSQAIGSGAEWIRFRFRTENGRDLVGELRYSGPPNEARRGATVAVEYLASEPETNRLAGDASWQGWLAIAAFPLGLGLASLAYARYMTWDGDAALRALWRFRRGAAYVFATVFVLFGLAEGGLATAVLLAVLPEEGAPVAEGTVLGKSAEDSATAFGGRRWLVRYRFTTASGRTLEAEADTENPTRWHALAVGGPVAIQYREDRGWSDVARYGRWHSAAGGVAYGLGPFLAGVVVLVALRRTRRVTPRGTSGP